MARKPLYDLDEVMALAVELFWERGYNGTSMDELINYTSFNRRSMYAEFGNKQKFYHAALNYYLEHKVNPLISALENNRGLISIEGYFYKLNRFLLGKGCLITNSVTELGHCDSQIKSIGQNFFQRLEQSFEACLTEANKQSQIKVGIAIDAFATQLLALVQGLGVMAKVCDSKQELDIAVEAILSPIRS